MNTFLTIVITIFLTWYVTSFFYENFKTRTVIKSADGSTTQIISGNNNSCNNLQINRTNGSIITINGKTYHGDIISSNDGVVYVDGKSVESSSNLIFNITIDGEVGSVDVGGGDVTVTGNIKESVKTGQGDITVNNGTVSGDVKTGQGNITIHGTLHGSAKTEMGNVSVK
jgi:hypothetical protein